MTFKHVKFEDSPIMRSLEKVAQEKGLIKSDPLKKLAAKPAVKKVDVTPSNNLMENIFKLCAGLRTQGLLAEANELEVDYFQYKQAQTLYEAHKEKGEDVIHSAHPDGSHKLEGVDGEEATFEDILDKHTKFLDMVGKTPTGKLSSSAHVLSEVKRALGQDAAAVSPRLKYEKTVNNLIGLCNTVLSSEKGNLSDWASPPRHLFGKSYTSSWSFSVEGHLESMISDLREELTKPSDEDQVKELTNYVNIFNYLISTAKSIPPEHKQTYMKQALGINAQVSNILNVMSGKAPALEEAGDKPAVSQSVKAYQTLLVQIRKSLNSAKFTIDADQDNTEQDKKQADAFITRILSYLTDNIEAKFNEATDKDTAADGLVPILNKINAKVAEFRKQWVG